MSPTFFSRLLLSALLSASFVVSGNAFAQSKSKPKVNPVLEQQVLEVLRKNPEVIYQVLKKFGEEQRAEQERKAKAEQVAAIQKLFQNSKTLIASSPTTGSTSNKILLVEFSDFQCPSCSRSSEIVKQFMAKHKDKVTLVFKNFPLTQVHPEALPAARAAWAAQQQGKFWEYHDELFANQAKLSNNFYLDTAKKLNLNLAKFQSDYGIADTAILSDFKLGRTIDVQGTPALILDGMPVKNPGSIAELEQLLAKAEKK
jgi:protein-disulfide isomerase